MSQQKKLHNVTVILFAAVLVVIDQLIKLRVLATLKDSGRIEVVRSLFYLTYVENRGAAFGIFQGKTTMLAVLTGVVLLGLLVYLLLGKVSSRLLTWTLGLVLAGGFGNLVDRLVRGYVVDYLDFSALFGFPVFNFADCCVVIGTILILCGIAWADVSVKGGGSATVESTESEA